VLPDARVYGAIQGLVNSYGDSYTVYLPPEDAETFGEDISGNFSGVGMEVGMRNGLITIISPLPDTPADNAGVLAGDIITRIDDESTEDMTVDQAVKRIRGEKGTEVTLQIAREGELSFIEIVIMRDTITIPTIETEERDDIFIISLYSFNALAEAKMQTALREFVKSDAEKLILDLRGNPGGYLQSAIGISSYFLPTGKVVVQESFGDGRPDQLFRSQGRVIKDFNAENFVVLVDGGSASASEIVAGALAEHGVATLLGTQTFGKGSVQELVDLNSGASLKVTVARWLTPDGTSISNGGLEPEIVIERTPEQRLNDEDPQLEAAIDYLSGRPVTSEVSLQW
jgi:carboxyl-terminal processing protease